MSRTGMRTVSFVLVIALALMLVPSLSTAAAGLQGSKTNPYVVTSYDELKSRLESCVEVYIKLGSDITLNSDTINNNYFMLRSGDLHLDLAGHTLTRKYIEVNHFAFYIDTNASLTIDDSVGGGAIRITDNTPNADSRLFYVCGSLTINAGSCSIDSPNSIGTAGGISSPGGSVVINGGSVTAENFALIQYHGTCTINGGSFHITGDVEESGLYALSFNSDSGDFTVNACSITSPKACTLFHISGSSKATTRLVTKHTPSTVKFTVDGSAYTPGVTAYEICGKSCTIANGSNPTITKQPAAASAYFGDAIVFSVEADNASMYKWYVCATADGGTPYYCTSADVTEHAEVYGADTNEIAFCPTDLWLNGKYVKCIAVSAGGRQQSSSRVLATVMLPTVKFTVSPTAPTAGQTVTVTAKVTGAPSGVGYTWDSQEVDYYGGFISDSGTVCSFTTNTAGKYSLCFSITIFGVSYRYTVPDITVSKPPYVFPFTDVPTSQWYYKWVKSSNQLGLIDGKTPTTFRPYDKITFSEIIKLAACMHQLNAEGAITLKNGTNGVWYSTYMQYCLDNGIIDRDMSDVAGQEVTRREYVEIFYRALPVSDFPMLNTIYDNSIPDVKITDTSADIIYLFYRTGILNGSDDYGTFHPDDNINRASVAAILVRLMDEDERVGPPAKLGQ